jgi:hypothetical protein
VCASDGRERIGKREKREGREERFPSRFTIEEDDDERE